MAYSSEPIGPAAISNVAPVLWTQDETADVGDGGLPLRFYGTLLRRHVKAIAAFVVLATAAAVLIAFTLPKEYDSTAILRIDPQGMQTLGENNESMAVQQSARELVLTESKEVTSPAVVMAAIQALHLDQNPEFSPNYTRRVASGSGLTPTDRAGVLTRVTKAISVDQPLSTYLLSVTVRSRAPQLSAQIANQLVESLIARDYTTRVQSLMNSSQAMEAQVDDLRSKMETSERDLVNYESSNDVLDPNSKDNIMQARLSLVNADLSQARSQRIALQAEYATASSGGLEALLASSRGQVLEPMHQQLLADQRRMAQDAQVYGPNFPIYREQAAVVRHDQQVLQQEQQDIERQVAAQYATALRREQLLQNALESTKSAMDVYNLKAIRYSALQAAAQSYSQLFFQLQQRIQDVSVAANLHAETLRPISPAIPSPRPVYPRPVLAGALSLVGSLALACVTVVLIGIMDRRVTNPEQVEGWFQVPFLASVPQIALSRGVRLDPIQIADPGHRPDADAGPTLVAVHQLQESVLSLHSALVFANGGAPRSLGVTSSLPGEGKSTLAAHLAVAFARLGQRTVLVDGDLRKPSVHRLFQCRNTIGLSSVLTGQCSLEQALIAPSNEPALTLLPAGTCPARPVELLHRGLEEVMQQLQAQFDCVLVDCPPVLGFADATVVGNHTDGIIVVARAGLAERTQVMMALHALRATRANILGIVLNGVGREHGSYYSYHAYGDYYTAAEKA
ncbi:MAG: GumC family protein [Terriglobales bacterium]